MQTINAVPVSKLDLAPLIQACLESEKSRSLSRRSLDELRHYLTDLAEYCRQSNLQSLSDIAPAFLKDFVQRYSSACLVKAAVWTVRKFGAYLALLQYLPQNPAKDLQHPRISRRAKLPEYLKPGELRSLLETAVERRSLAEVTVLSLLATAGLRPHEVAQLRRKDINTVQQVILLRVKGGWLKRTPISAIMAQTLEDYLEHHPETGETIFSNAWGKPVDKRWVLRLVRAAGKEAGIERTITPRMLRHTFATYLADRHGKQVTKAALGHSANHSTDVYMHLIPGKYRKYANTHPFQTVVGRGR